MRSAIVIGAGVGGLAAAARLAAAGVDVQVFEAGARAGGKAGVQVVDGVGFDTGPSVLTLPEVFAELFGACGERLEDHVRLRQLDPGFRYTWPDGRRVDTWHAPSDTVADVRRSLGPDAADDLEGFLAHACDVWEASAPRFLFGPALDWTTPFRVPPHEWWNLVRAEPFRTMRSGIARRVRSLHVRDLLERYATYNGSDPRSAPATLNCIAHVELGLGAYGVEGGIGALVDALVALAERMGAEIALDSPVRRILRGAEGIEGVELEDGSRHLADAVFCNADVGHLVQQLLPEAERAIPKGAPSTSGWTAVVATTAPPVAPHLVAFPDVYEREFEDLFDAERPPVNPTVYACDQALAHGRTGWADGSRPLFLMANAPVSDAEREDQHWVPLRERVLARAVEEGWIRSTDRVVWERTPAGLARRFPGTRGALYGVASNSALAAFRRPPNRVRAIPRLYLASGSAHPGGGLPLCALSGRHAAEAALADLAPEGQGRKAPRKPSPGFRVQAS